MRRDDGFSAYQVCHELNPANRDREIGGLLECCRAVGLKHGTILTFDQEGEEKHEGIALSITPTWRWLIERTY